MTKQKKRHGPEEIVRKLRDADAMLNAGKDVITHVRALNEALLVQGNGCDLC
jgi:putative transposase